MAECRRTDEANRPSRTEAEEREAYTKRMLLAIRNVNQLIVAETDPQRLIERACANLTKTLDYFSAWIALLDDSGREVKMTGASGFDRHFEPMRQQLAQGVFPACMTKALREQATVVVDHPKEDCPSCPVAPAYVDRASLVRRLAFSDKVYGILAVSAPRPCAYDAEQKDLFKELADDLSLALNKIEAAEALRNSEARYRRFVETALEGVWAMNAEHNTTFVNQRMASMLGYTPQQMLGRKVEEFMFEEDLPAYRRRMQSRHEGKGGHYEHRFRHVDGGEVWTLISATAIMSQQGQFDGSFAMFTDITERKRAIRAMERSEQRYRALFEGAPVGIGLATLDGHVLMANRAMEELFGYAAEELECLDIADLYEDPTDWISLLKHIELKGYVSNHPARTRRRDGRPVEILISSSRIQSDGRALLQTMYVDITERKRIEERLRTASEMLDTAPSSITVHDSDGRFLYANRKTFEIHGRTEHEFMALNLHQLDVPATAALIAERMETLAAKGETSFEVEHFRKDGSTFPLEIYVKQVTWEGVPAILSIGTDITERKQAKEMLDQHRAELQAIYDHAPVMMCVLDTDRQVLYANRAFAEFTGVSENDLKGGRACGVFGCINAQTDPRGCGFGPACEQCKLHLALEDTLRTGVGHRNIEYRATLEQESGQRDVALLGATAVIHTGERSNVLLCLEDRTEREQAEQRARERELELLHVSRLGTLDEMASGLAHELSQPLSAILNYSTACTQLASADRPDVERIARNIRKITGQAERARDIMVRIKSFAQRRQPHLTSVGLNQAVTGVLDLLSWEIRRGGVHVNLELADLLPPVQADVVQIEQVLFNLARNAVEAMAEVPSERKRLTIRTAAGDAETVRVEVCDFGVGLPQDTPERVFDAFFTTKTDGLGIGLSISRAIVEMHGGTLQAIRNPESGSTFVMVLPRASMHPGNELGSGIA